MTSKELERAVERLKDYMNRPFGAFLGAVSVCADDLRALLSERAELLAAVERMREALESIAANTCCETCREAALVARAALTTGEANHKDKP